MRRALWVLIVLGLITAAGLWLAGLGGQVSVHAGDYAIEAPFGIAALVFVLFCGLLLLLASLLGSLRRWPQRRRLRRADKRRQKGEQAVTLSLVALAEGAGPSARQHAQRARKFLGDTPQTLLLAAQSARAAGDEAAAAADFKALTAIPDARFLGLRGLLRAAMERGDWPTAQGLVRQAEAAAPGAAWLREIRGQLALRLQDWPEALALSPPEIPPAALAMAAARQAKDPEVAADYEKRALSEDPAFVPAALARARRLMTAGSQRKARQVLLKAWEISPQPEIGDLYLEVQVGKDPLARVKAAEQLTADQPNHPESLLLQARAAQAAGVYGLARERLLRLVQMGKADQRPFLMLAELAAPSGAAAMPVAGTTEILTPTSIQSSSKPQETVSAADWLRRAAAAPAAPAWHCASCGAEAPAWQPVCPACGTVGRLQWGHRTSDAITRLPQAGPPAI